MRVYGRRVRMMVVMVLFAFQAPAQERTASELFYSLRTKLESIKDYTADVKLKIDVFFMRIPTVSGKLYFKSPDKMKLERNGGIAIMPRKSISLSLNNLVPAGNATVIDAGFETMNGRKVHVIKVVPENDQTDIVLTKIWVDEERMLALRTETTTRDNGTVKMDLTYGRFIELSLPDQVIFYIDVKEFKMPKGVTMDYDPRQDAVLRDKKPAKPGKGRIQINYLNYKVNTGLSDRIFEEPGK